ETCTVKLSSGPTSFRSTAVKPYYQSMSEPEADKAIHPSEEPQQEPQQEPQLEVPQPKRGRGRPRKYPILTGMADISIYLQEDASQCRTLCIESPHETRGTPKKHFDWSTIDHRTMVNT